MRSLFLILLLMISVENMAFVFIGARSQAAVNWHGPRHYMDLHQIFLVCRFPQDAAILFLACREN